MYKNNEFNQLIIRAKMMKPNLLFFLGLSLIVGVSSKCPKLVVPFSQVNCTDKATDTEAYYYWLDERESCVPTCKLYVTQVTDDCVNGQCMPGYACEHRCQSLDTREHTCESRLDCTKEAVPGGSNRNQCRHYCIKQTDVKVTACMAYHCNSDDYKHTFWTALKWKPICENDGTYAAKQCKGGLSGRCMCFSKTGTRIFGQALRRESDDMTCACSRKKSDLEASGKPYVSFHCDSKGNYEKLQCDVLSEQCWCAEPKTGDLTSPVVPMKAMNKLTCYVPASLGSQYLRKCESEKYAQTVINQKLTTHGVKYTAASSLLCDDDGSYGNYYVSKGTAYCSWRDKSKIENWMSNAGVYEGVDCKCARDFKLYGDTLTCSGNGNYEPLQQFIQEGVAYYYCVDSDGFAKSEPSTDKTIDCAQFY